MSSQRTSRVWLAIAAAVIASALPARAQVAQPLPDPAKLLEAVRDNQKQVEEIVKNYVYMRTEEEEEFDKQGNVKKRTVSVYEVTMAGDVSRLISRNGQPLSDKEQKKQDERVQKRVRDLEKKRAKAKKESEEDDSDLRISDILRATRFSNGRREVIDGRSVVAYDFEPAADFKPKNRAQDVANKLAGTIWIDDAASQVAKVEARLVEGVRIIGGILGSVSPGAQVVFEQKRVNDEVWLPSLVKASAGYRVLFSRNNMRQTVRFSEYKKFRVEHAITGVQETTTRE